MSASGAVMISGGTGFVGLNIAEALLARGETVILFALDDPPEAAQRSFAALPGRLILERGDVRDSETFPACLRRHAVDRMFPFAAITSGPDRERDAPERVFEVNLLGVLAQLRAARDAGISRIIVPSSGSIYGESAYGQGPLREDTTPPFPLTVYGVSKYAVERTALRMAGLWNLDLIVARIGAVFGPWERDTGLRDTLSPFFQVEHAASTGVAAILPQELPPYAWVYSRDLAAGLLHLLDLAPPPHRVFNVCSGRTWGDALLDWCRTLQHEDPSFIWRQSADASECTIRLADLRPRAPLSVERIVSTGWLPRFTQDAAFADYLAWRATQ